MQQDIIRQLKYDTIANIAALIVMFVGIATYYQSQRREKTRREQQHTEDRVRVEQFNQFLGAQQSMNERQEKQLLMLSTIAATTTETLKGIDRRLQLMENKS